MNFGFVKWRERLAGGQGRLAASIAAALTLLPMGAPLRAELTWNNQSIELYSGAPGAVLEARFRFANHGTTPVEIRQIQTSCGCVLTELEQRHYEPGQTGELVARYTVGAQAGVQQKLIAVSFSGQTGATMLTLRVHIAEAVRLQPATVSWDLGGANTAQVIKVTSVQSALPVTGVAVEAADPAITATVQPAADANSYEISVHPNSTSQRLLTILTIRCHLGSEDRILRAFASVQPPVPPTAVTK